jgi:hypothetical protein
MVMVVYLFFGADAGVSEQIIRYFLFVLSFASVLTCSLLLNLHSVEVELLGYLDPKQLSWYCGYLTIIVHARETGYSNYGIMCR